jgi:hypothetical protein
VLLLVLAGAGTAAGQMVGSVHDFVDDGFTGGGACAACHVPHNAQDARLYPRAPAGATAPMRLCMDCHDGTMPTGNGWPATWVGPTPPPPGGHVSDVAGDNSALSCRDDGQQTCGTCHKHQNAFAFVGGCFDCHTTEAEQELVWGAGQAFFPDATEQCMQVDRRFDGIGAVADSTLLSQHNIADSSVGCQKCHGSGHPGDAGLLAYADDVGGQSLGDPVPRSNDRSTYQAFCFSCHDGTDLSVSPVPDTTFSGPLGTNQVAPSLRSNPASLQAGPTWVVPAIPPRDAAPGENTPPFLDYFTTNGHGAAANTLTGLSPLTCLADVNGGTQQGCHVAHGSGNRFLMDDVNGIFDPPGPGLDTATDFGQACSACHVPGLSGVSLFHSWVSNTTILHDDTLPDGGAPITDGMSRMRVLTANMNITTLGTAGGILPFYPGTAVGDLIHERAYPGDLAVGTHWLTCLTCHDPHGTDDTTAGSIGDAFLQPGLLRMAADLANATDLYTVPLCAQCHN